jgi:hypothetical protein
MEQKAPAALATLTNQAASSAPRQRGVKSPCTRSQTRRAEEVAASPPEADAPSVTLCDLPDGAPGERPRASHVPHAD